MANGSASTSPKRSLQTWLDEVEADQFVRLAHDRERSVAAQLRIAVREFVERAAADDYEHAERELTRLENVGGKV
jgi:hypothetical protein